MCDVAFSIPNEVLYDTKMTKNDALAFARKSVALCYYVQNGVSIFHYDDEDEFIEELNNG